MKASLAVSALRSAITRPEPADTVVHSDGDSQFRSNAFVRTRKNNGLIGSTVGTPEHDYGWRSSPGPRRPAADDDGAASRPSGTRHRPPPQPRSGHPSDEFTGMRAPPLPGRQPGGADLPARVPVVPPGRCSAGRPCSAIAVRGRLGRQMFRFEMPGDAGDRVPSLCVWTMCSAGADRTWSAFNRPSSNP